MAKFVELFDNTSMDPSLCKNIGLYIHKAFLIVVYWNSGYQPICTHITLFTILHFKYIQVYSSKKGHPLMLIHE